MKVNIALLERQHGGVLAAVYGVDRAFRVGALRVFEGSRFASGIAVGN